MSGTRTAGQSRHSESREQASGFLLPLFSLGFRPSLREDILCVVTRCPHAAPRRLKMFFCRTGSSLPKCRIASVASWCSHEHTVVFPTFFPDMPYIKRFFTRTKRLGSTGRQPGTKSASRPADKPVINRGSNADFVPPSVYIGFRLFVLLESRSREIFAMPWRVWWIFFS